MTDGPFPAGLDLSATSRIRAGYLAGPNHVLPTGGSARFFSPLGTYDFLKRTTIIQAEKRALRALAPRIIQLARLEGLDDHARAVEARFE